MTDETPFRLMWTDEEGDNICFSTDEELAQALKFVKGQENQLFKVIIKTPQVQQEQAQAAREARARNNPQADFAAATFARGAAEFGEGMNQMASHFCRQFGDKSNSWNTNEKMAHKMGKKCEKMKAKQQFHEEKARMLNEMIKNINPNMQQHIQALINGSNPNVSTRANGDVDIAVDIPINRLESSSTTTTTTSTGQTTGNTGANVYPDLAGSSSAPMEEDFTDVTEDVNRDKMNEAMKKMAELGFEGDWVKTLLETVNCDIAKAVDKLNPERS